MLIVPCENCLVLEHIYFIFQPWAFPAREFLRKKLIGKEVCFTIENKTPQGREYGMIYLGKGEYQGGKVLIFLQVWSSSKDWFSSGGGRSGSVGCRSHWKCTELVACRCPGTPAPTLLLCPLSWLGLGVRVSVELFSPVFRLSACGTHWLCASRSEC